jgi:hypothetical protein
MRRFVAPLTVVSLLALLTGMAMAIPAGASSSVSHLRVVRASTLTVTPQNVNIVGQKKEAAFDPNSITAPEDSSGGDCMESSPSVSFTVTNTGKQTAYVTFEGSPNFMLKKHGVAPVCIYGLASGSKVDLGLTNKKDTKTYVGSLTITLS